MRTTFVADDGVNFVENEGSRSLQHASTAIAGQQDVKRLRRGDDDVRWALRHRSTFRSGCVAGANESSNIYFRQTERFQLFLNSFERNLKISLHVVAECFQR